MVNDDTNQVPHSDEHINVATSTVRASGTLNAAAWLAHHFNFAIMRQDLWVTAYCLPQILQPRTRQLSHECQFTLVVITGLEGNMIVEALHTQVPNLLKHMRSLPLSDVQRLCISLLPTASNAAELPCGNALHMRMMVIDDTLPQKQT
jgi:hypothetical protein